MNRLAAHRNELRRQYDYPMTKRTMPFWRFYLRQSWLDWLDHHVYAYDAEAGEWYKRFTWRSQERW
jgi:hypothetical protein